MREEHPRHDRDQDRGAGQFDRFSHAQLLPAPERSAHAAYAPISRGAAGAREIGGCSRRAPPGPRPLDPRAVNQELFAAGTCEQLLRVVASHAPTFNAVNESTAVSRLAKLLKQEARGHARAADEPLQSEPFRALLERIASRLEGVGEAYDARHLSNVSHDLAQLRVSGAIAGRIWQGIARAAEQRVREFNSQGLANTAWAFATAGVRAPELFAAIARSAEQRVREFNPQELSNTAWAFATVGVRAPELFLAIARAAEQRMHEFNPQDLSNTAWAFATADIRTPELFEAIARAAEQRVHEFNPQNLANMAWALAVLDERAGRVVLALAERALSETVSVEDATSLAQALLTVRVLAAAGETETRADAARLLAIARSQRGDMSSHPSRLQRDVSAALRAAGWEHEEEVSVEEGLLQLDMASAHTRVAVEVNGPSHYLVDVSTREQSHNGSTRWKSKLLEALGWRLVRVGYREWGNGGDDRAKLVQAVLAHAA